MLLLTEEGPAAPRLYALTSFDTAQLCASRWNLGALYLLPELRTERFESFRLRREELRSSYAALARIVIAENARSSGEGEEYLPFRLVETVINMRSDDGQAPDYAPQLIPAAALRVLGWSGDGDALRAAADSLLELMVKFESAE